VASTGWSWLQQENVHYVAIGKGLHQGKFSSKPQTPESGKCSKQAAPQPLRWRRLSTNLGADTTGAAGLPSPSRPDLTQKGNAMKPKHYHSARALVQRDDIVPACQLLLLVAIKPHGSYGAQPRAPGDCPRFQQHGVHQCCVTGTGAGICGGYRGEV